MKQTEKNIIEAVSSIILTEGFSKLGINRIAKVAGCDKVLIYRYFGGIEGLISRWAKENDYYSFAIDMFKEKINSSDDMRSVAKEILIQQLRFIRESRMMQELILWELSGNSTFDYIRNTRE
ncbi:MAG: TetR/AcrR family transcriptional regulator, partial [Muribaculaceae bacterium]|nr:TetR/AcrR family transcriptional regulator [Muribaculaceae bacterium]